MHADAGRGTLELERAAVRDCKAAKGESTLVQVVVLDLLDPANRHRVEVLAKAKQYMRQNGVNTEARRRVRAHLLTSFDERGESPRRRRRRLRRARDPAWLESPDGAPVLGTHVVEGGVGAEPRT